MKPYYYLIIAILFVQCKPVQKKYMYNEGEVFGTFYHITYESPNGKDLLNEIKTKFNEFDLSLSTYNPHSIISRINSNEPDVKTDAYFEEMFAMAQQVSEKSDGAFDITVAPLVNAWGFGYTNEDRQTIPPDALDTNRVLMPNSYMTRIGNVTSFME